MILPYSVLYEDLRRRNITVNVKDLRYDVLDVETSQKFVKAIRRFDELLNEFSKEYEADMYDCDDFALLFKAVCHLHNFTCAYAEGGVFVGNQFYGMHAFNLIPYFINDKLIWLVVEPQVVGVRGFRWYNVLPENRNRVEMLGLYVYEVNYVWL
jgi:hypothetical protein